MLNYQSILLPPTVGAMFSMFILLYIWLNTVAMSGNNATDPGSIVLGAILSIIDPVFAFWVLIMFQHNFLAAKSNNSDGEVLSIGSAFVTVLVVDIFIYSALLVYFECRGMCFAQMGKIQKQIAAPFVSSSQGRRLVPLQKQSSLRMLASDDPDVLQEKERVAGIAAAGGGNIDTSLHAIFIYSLSKIFYGKGTVPTKVAVKSVSISVARGEIFGLLGANGAGKTTLLKIVSGLELPSGGSALINGFDIAIDTVKAQRSMGLCPQFDTLIGQLTVKENLIFFGKIKGISESQLMAVVDAYLVALNIKQYESKLTQRLSGGNRRKVSLAVALLGCPPTVYLDEPSTGKLQA